MRAHAGVNHGNMHRAWREKRRRAPQRDRALTHILGGNVVGDIRDLRAGSDTPDNPFERTDKAVQVAKISREGNNRHTLRLTFRQENVKKT